jgi:hypothetical protein
MDFLKNELKFTYYGQLKSGKPEGTGLAIYKNGDIYYGNWVNGETVGGTWLDHNGTQIPQQNIFDTFVRSNRIISKEVDNYLEKTGIQLIYKNGEIIFPININELLYEIKIIFNFPYLFTLPKFVLIKPFLYIFPKTIYTGVRPFYEIIENLIQPHLLKIIEMRNNIEQKLPKITNPAYLVIGNNPYGDQLFTEDVLSWMLSVETPPEKASAELKAANKNRLLANKNIFLLDNVDPSFFEKKLQNFSSIDASRYIRTNFSDPMELGTLSSLLHKQFDEIWFDSAFVFFRSDRDYTKNDYINNKFEGTMLLERFIYLKNMLKDGGRLFIRGYMAAFGRSNGDTTDYGAIIISKCNEAGFVTKIVNRNEIFKSEIIPSLRMIHSVDLILEARLP